MTRALFIIVCSAPVVLSACKEDPPVAAVTQQTATPIDSSLGYFALSEEEKDPSSFEPLLEENPEDYAARVAALTWYMSERDIDKLKHHTALMIQHHPAESMIQFANSSAFYEDRQFLIDSIEQLEARLASGANEHGVLWNLASLCEQAAIPPVGADPQQRAEFVRYYGLPDDTEFLTEVDQEFADKAVKYFRSAVDAGAEEDFYVVFYSEQLTTLLRGLDRIEEAVQVCERALPHVDKSANPDFLTTYGEALWASRRIDEAKEALSSVRKRDAEGFEGGPGHATTLAETYLGLIALQEGDLTIAGEQLLSSTRVQRCCHNITKGFPLILARRLVEVGEHEVVAEFCQVVARDFTPDRPELRTLLEQARSSPSSESDPSGS